MNLKIVEEYSDNNNFNLEFEEDGIGMTWGVSHIRLTIGQKANFENIEHFFYSTIRSDKNVTSGSANGPTWEERVNIKEWIRNLKITAVPTEDLIYFIADAVKEINENSKYWQKINTIDISKLDITKNYENCIMITEGVFPRHYINVTEIYLTYDDARYYSIEGHWES